MERCSCGADSFSYFLFQPRSSVSYFFFYILFIFGEPFRRWEHLVGEACLVFFLLLLLIYFADKSSPERLPLSPEVSSKF